MAQACRHPAGHRCSGSVRDYRRQRAPRPSPVRVVPAPLHTSVSKHPLQPNAAPAPGSQSPCSGRQTRTAERPGQCRAPPEASASMPAAGLPQKHASYCFPTSETFLLFQQLRSKPSASSLHTQLQSLHKACWLRCPPRTTCPHLCAPHHPGPGCRWEPLLGLPTLALAPASAPHTAPKETAVRSDPITATEIHLPVAPHFTPSE